MSIEAMTWALRQPVDHSSAKFVLVVLANCADKVGGLAWPSVSYLCEATSQDRKTVIANIARLKEAGFIEDTGERRGSTGQVIVYRLNSTENVTVKESQKRNSTENGTVPKTDGNSTVFPVKESRFSVETVPKTGYGTINEPPIEPSENQKTQRASRSSSVTADRLVAEHGVDPQVASDWMTVRKAKKSPLTETALGNLKNQFASAGLTVAEGVLVCVQRGWVGFKPDWLKNEVPNETGANHRRRLTPADVCRLENEQHAARRAGHVYNA